jgi:hypothetical protein
MNRCVPFLLPTNVETQIRSFMSTVDLVTGSIDLIYGTDNVFYFLEVNPIGQFGYLSAVNNAHLEREVALALTKND